MGTPAAGHNSKKAVVAYAERLNNLEAEIATLREDVKELKAEAKENDVDPKEVVAVARLLRKGKEIAHAERDAFDNRLEALGWLD